MNKLFIISNESIYRKKEIFFCDNIDIKSTSEGLSKNYEVSLIARKSKKKRSHKIKLKNVKASLNFFYYIYEIIRSFKKKEIKYLIISITPYTFLITIFLKLFKKKTLVYLRSNGYEEYQKIFGLFGKFIYHFMFVITSNISPLISCRKHILMGKKGEIVDPSQLNSNWKKNLFKSKINEIKLLYVGRIRKEKGIFSLINLIENIKMNFTLSIVGAESDFNSTYLKSKKNIIFYKIEANEKKLIKFYDDNNIFILPSYTEGNPMVILEALSRLRPVIIFEEIKHVIENRKGIFVAKRDTKSLRETISYIKNNYNTIYNEMKLNILPTKKNFIRNLSLAISSLDRT